MTPRPPWNGIRETGEFDYPNCTRPWVDYPYRTDRRYIEATYIRTCKCLSAFLSICEHGDYVDSEEFIRHCHNLLLRLLKAEKPSVYNHVHNIISKLCKTPSAWDEFQLDDGVWLDNHANALDEIEGGESQVNHLSKDKGTRLCILQALWCSLTCYAVWAAWRYDILLGSVVCPTRCFPSGKPLKSSYIIS